MDPASDRTPEDASGPAGGESTCGFQVRGRPADTTSSKYNHWHGGLEGGAPLRNFTWSGPGLGLGTWEFVGTGGLILDGDGGWGPGGAS